jgi:hypothetical protein
MSCPYIKDKKIYLKKTSNVYKRAKVKVLKKYDNNKDSIITLNEFLEKEESQGPKAEIGKIGYHYQHYDNVYNYFTILMSTKLKYDKVMCIPQFVVRYNNIESKTTALYDITNNNYYFPKSMRNSIKFCYKENIRLIYFTFAIKDSRSWVTHANMMIIDIYNSTIERFEPYGRGTPKEERQIDNFVKDFVLEFLKIESYRYISPSNISDKIGIQTIADSYCGMCVTISMMYLQMRLLNLDVKQSKIIKYMINIPKKKLKSKILRFARYVEKTLKKHSNKIDKNRYENYVL